GVPNLGRHRVIGPVTEHHGVTARAQFAGSATRHDAPLRIYDLDLTMRMDAPDSGDAPLYRVVSAALETDRGGLGHAVGDRYLPHVHPVDRASHHFHRTRAPG